MTDLHEKINRAQVRAGEDAVMESLREKGLLPPDPTPPTAAELAAEIEAVTQDRDRYKRMHEFAVSSLSAIDTALGIPEEDAGGAAPILAAIERLRFAAKVNAPTYVRDEAMVIASMFGKDALRDAVADVLGNERGEDEERVDSIADVLRGFPSFQARVLPWLLECFGAEIAADKRERNHRFLEEALEVVQAGGCTASEAHQLVDYVFGRPVGELHQEVGGAMVTLAALCLASGLNMHDAGEVELARIWGKVPQIRAKQAAKPKHSPLPQ